MAQKNVKTIIGIDIGIDSLKTVLLSHEGDEFQCLGTIVKPLLRGADSANSLFEGLKEACAKFGQYSKKAVLVIPERMVQYKFFGKPMMPEDQLRLVIDNEMKTMLSSAQSNISTVENDKIEYLYASLGQVTGGGTKKNNLMSIFASMSGLNNFVALFKKAGLTLEGVYTVPQVTHEFINVSFASEFEDASKQIATLNLGASANYLTIHREKILLLGRSFPFAGDEITKELAGINVSASQTDALKISDGENYKRVIGILSPEEMSGYEDNCAEIKVSQKIRGLIGQIMQKIRLAIEYIKTQEGIPVAKFFLFGGGAAMRGIVDQLKEVFSTDEITIIEPFTTIRFSPVEPQFAEIPQENQPLFIPAIGAGICALKPQPQMIDLLNILRRERDLIRRQLIEKYLPLILVIATGIMAIGVYYIFWYRDFVETKAKLSRNMSMVTETYQPIQSLKIELDKVVAEKLALEGKIELVKILLTTRVKWSKFFLRVAALIPSDVWFESFKTSRVGSGSVNITIAGKASSMTLVNQFQQRLQGSGLFNLIEWQGSKNAGEGTVFGFTFAGELATKSVDLQ
ncbi:MAG: pilus assembly protein PilM [Candidatus Ozemobacteraceae bacterium]|jgi:Tfp pilus assembly PilM family ATPase/Tfp pilus assembly protein PilN